MADLDLTDLLAHAGAFDADWYAQSYPDVGLTAMDPALHYLRYGRLMGRGISQAHPNGQSLERLHGILDHRPTISYCIPIKDRPDDIRATLPDNLRETAPFRDKVEFLVIFFDEDTETHDWIRTHFAEALSSGYLRLILSDTLDSWHFGKAKNAFRAYARGRVYSSLDGDNFVTQEETAQLLDVARDHPDGFLFHHFSGIWGDGSCGRVSLPMELYTRVGYDEQMLPRQYDEVDMILSSLARAPDIPLLRYDISNHGLSSTRSTRFMAEAGIDNPVEILPDIRRSLPLNPSGEDYLAEDGELQRMQDFNQALCFLKNSPDPAKRKTYLEMAVRARHRLVDGLSAERLIDALFWHDADLPEPEARLGGLSLVACMKDDPEFLAPFYAHYRAMGVERFFIVDDGSEVPILPQEDVHVFRPKTGSFVTSKGLWLGALIKAYMAPGSWVLTVDADEFIDPPEGYTDLATLAQALERDTRRFAPGLLIDLLPEPGTQPEGMEGFTHHLALETPASTVYRNHHSISWGFGAHADLSWRFDARFHAFGTFDSLRKIPLIRTRERQHLNQGFHTLHYTDSSPAPGAEIWESPVILPIRHYKFASLLAEAGRTRISARSDTGHVPAYHQRTAENMRRILETGPEEAAARLADLPLAPYQAGLLSNMFHKLERETA